MDKLKDNARMFGIELSLSQCGQFESFARELIKWNLRMNLTAITDPDEIAAKHFLDSLSVTAALSTHDHTLIDIGTGAGFPGIPVKIARPDMKVTLLDASEKKISFLNHVIDTLELREIEAIHSRAENLSRDPHYREKFDVATARAVAHLATIAEYALPFVLVEGLFIAQKISDETEIADAKNALRELGGRLADVTKVDLPGIGERHLIIVEKIAPTPEKYPRRAGIPSKRPLT
jgi:16S rRNA (guanine527-N7)-methyltransferase